MADFILKGKADEYQGKLDLLNGCLGDLESLRSAYQAHLASLNDVLDESDSNINQLRATGEENIRALDTSIKHTENRRDAVQAALAAINEVGENARSALDAGLQAATSSVEAAVRIGKLIG